MQAVTRYVFDRADVAEVLPAAHPDVEAIRAGEHLVVINHGERHRVVSLDSTHVLGDAPVAELELEPYGYAVVQRQRLAVWPSVALPVTSTATRPAWPTAAVRPGGGTG
jgi:hypothetical protein